MTSTFPRIPAQRGVEPGDRPALDGDAAVRRDLAGAGDIAEFVAQHDDRAGERAARLDPAEPPERTARDRGGIDRPVVALRDDLPLPSLSSLPMSAGTVVVWPVVTSVRTPVVWMTPETSLLVSMSPRMLGAVMSNPMPMVEWKIRSPSGPVLVIAEPTGRFDVSEPPSPTKLMVWMIDWLPNSGPVTLTRAVTVPAG